MLTKLFSIFPVVFITLIIGASVANAGGFIVSGGASANILIEPLSSGTVTTYGGNIGIGHDLGSSFELLVFASYLGTSFAGTTSNSTAVTGDLNFIISGSHPSALYVGGLVGTSNNSGGGSSVLTYGGILGKRFPIAGIVSYDPNVTVTVTSSSGTTSNPVYDITLLQFTLFF